MIFKLTKWFYKKSLSANDEWANDLAVVTLVIWTIVIIIGFCGGVTDANDSHKCEVRSIGVTALSLPYAVGCFIGKDRFLIKYN